MENHFNKPLHIGHIRRRRIRHSPRHFRIRHIRPLGFPHNLLNRPRRLRLRIHHRPHRRHIRPDHHPRSPLKKDLRFGFVDKDFAPDLSRLLNFEILKSGSVLKKLFA